MELSNRSEESRTVQWKGPDAASGSIRTIDQTKLPGELVWHTCASVQEAHSCIRDMVVRGAPAIGVLGAYAMVLALQGDKRNLPFSDQVGLLEEAKTYLDSARPTAVNLSWATKRIVQSARRFCARCEEDPSGEARGMAELVLREARRLAEQDVQINIAMAKHGASVVPDNANILHHCNTGALATVDVGTALGVIYECHYQKKNVHVWVDETRPRLQGARLSAWELLREGVPCHLIADNAAGLLMLSGKVDIVLYGADRVAANGDVVNKIGTYKISVVARENQIPVFAVVPTSTIDLSVPTGDEIPIEERSSDEVSCIGGVRIAPEQVPVYNPAFDITPHRYVTGIITEEGICYPPFSESLRAAKERAESKVRSGFEF